jgi:hypothetical protein
VGVKYAVFPCCHQGFKLLSQALKNHPAIDKSPKIKVWGGRVFNLLTYPSYLRRTRELFEAPEFHRTFVYTFPFSQYAQNKPHPLIA